MNPNLDFVLRNNREKAKLAISRVEASLARIRNRAIPDQNASDKELEPYDALCDRFIRAVESSIKYFKTVEYSVFAEQSDTLRDLLNRMEKMKLVASVELWLEMRDVRNRIVHEYLPAAFQQIIEDIVKRFGPELVALSQKLETE